MPDPYKNTSEIICPGRIQPVQLWVKQKWRQGGGIEFGLGSTRGNFEQNEDILCDKLSAMWSSPVLMNTAVNWRWNSASIKKQAPQYEHHMGLCAWPWIDGWNHCLIVMVTMDMVALPGFFLHLCCNHDWDQCSHRNAEGCSMIVLAQQEPCLAWPWHATPWARHIMCYRLGVLQFALRSLLCSSAHQTPSIRVGRSEMCDWVECAGLADAWCTSHVGTWVGYACISRKKDQGEPLCSVV